MTCRSRNDQIFKIIFIVPSRFNLDLIFQLLSKNFQHARQKCNVILKKLKSKLDY